ncbi:MAG: hydroxyisourate hydrolase [Gemmatimonadales bacterium]
MATLSTHVLDVSIGRPAAGMAVALQREGRMMARGTTDAEGRIGSLSPAGGPLTPGVYQLRFATGEYFRTRQVEAFFPEVVVSLTVGAGEHYHVPLLLSPFGYSIYRGT